ncbi:unnamed protein product, partial [Ectocarpus sp. 13 AM-2016]
MVVTPAPIPVTEPPVPMTAQPVTVPPTNAPVREVTPAPIAVTEPPVAVKRTKAPETVLPSSAPVSGGTVTGATVDLTSDAPTAGRALAAAVGLSSVRVLAACSKTMAMEHVRYDKWCGGGARTIGHKRVTRNVATNVTASTREGSLLFPDKTPTNLCTQLLTLVSSGVVHAVDWLPSGLSPSAADAHGGSTPSGTTCPTTPFE